MEYAGYTLRTSLAWTNEVRGGPVGLWNLTQMPHGGDLLVPTCCPSQPRVLFGDVSSQDLETHEHLIRYAMRAPGEHKIAIRATAATGRIGYRYRIADGRWALIVRNVFVDPSGLYVDVPWSDVEDLGYAVQACNIHSALGRFSELEYHVPAIGPGTGLTRCEDVSQTWAFRGDDEAIDQIVEMPVDFGCDEDDMKVDLTNRVALVTGAARGIGQAIADMLADNGARVYYSDVDSVEVRRAAACRAGAIAVDMDVSNEDQVQRGGRSDRCASRDASIFSINNAGVNTMRAPRADRPVPARRVGSHRPDRLDGVIPGEPHRGGRDADAAMGADRQHFLHRRPGSACDSSVLSWPRRRGSSISPRPWLWNWEPMESPSMPWLPARF